MNQNTQTLFWRANTVIIAHQEPLYEEWKLTNLKSVKILLVTLKPERNCEICCGTIL